MVLCAHSKTLLDAWIAALQMRGDAIELNQVPPPLPSAPSPARSSDVKVNTHSLSLLSGEEQKKDKSKERQPKNDEKLDEPLPSLLRKKVMENRLLFLKGTIDRRYLDVVDLLVPERIGEVADKVLCLSFAYLHLLRMNG